MIRGNLRKRFHTIWWRRPESLPDSPVIFACNHHHWHDGYLMFAAVQKLGIPTLDWIEEFDSFPMFRHIGGMPFPKGEPAQRAAIIRQTIRRMEQGWSLILFADGVLRRPSEPWQIGKALPLIARKTGATVLPTAIRCELSMHERPEAWIEIDSPCAADQAEERLREMLANPSPEWGVLAPGTRDVNERMQWPGR